MKKNTRYLTQQEINIEIDMLKGNTNRIVAIMRIIKIKDDAVAKWQRSTE